jgi:hypothetical protein
MRILLVLARPLRTCAKRLDFCMMTLHDKDRAGEKSRLAHMRHIEKALANLPL